MEKSKAFLPGKKGDPGKTAKNNKLFVEAVLYRDRAGIPWKDLPFKFGSFKSIHTRFSRWNKKEVWEKIFEILSLDSDNEYAI